MRRSEARDTRAQGTAVEAIAKRRNDAEEEPRRVLVPSGSIMLNLACSNSRKGFSELGRMSNLIGDSDTGKTYLALEMLAQCANNPIFDNHRLIFDDAEKALSMDIPYLFGEALADRIDWNGEDVPIHSNTIEELEYNVTKALDDGPCIYVLDSFDAIASEDDMKKLDEDFEAREKGREAKGSYRTGKAKYAASALPRICSKLEKTNSFLLIISQTRDNINPMSPVKKTRSGGRALKFYAQHEIWLAVKGQIKSKNRIVGSDVLAKISKNKLTGLHRSVEFSLRHGYGCDDIAACLDFLLEEGGVTKKSNTLEWDGFRGTKEKIIRDIEDDNAEGDLFKETEKVWNEVEDSLRPNRKSKYA